MSGLACDVLVIGGGSTGVCAAYDLARRGLDVILAEMNDLTTGTSGRFHGLLHSGARYAGTDLETARECIAENRILRRIVPHIIEDTGGLFVATPDDPPDYVPQWLEGCAAAGIPTEELSLAEVQRLEPALRPDLVRAFRVPDGAVDGFDLGHAFIRAAEGYGARTLIYQEVTALAYESGGMVATLTDRRSGQRQTVAARWVLNAAGPWAGRVAALAGHDLAVRYGRGVMVAMNTRWVNTIINRLRPPDDGDILVPVGTVSVIGTTSVLVDRPDDNALDPAEISRMLDEGEAIIPGFRQARALRAWAGVRPLYDPPGGGTPGAHDDADGRELSRTFGVVRHKTGFTSVVGGKLTTARLMAERAADDVCAGLGLHTPCTTADALLPTDPPRRYHTLGGRMDLLESGQMPGPLICECEMISRPQLEAAIASYDGVPTLDDLRRDLRLGMGPCQGGFCAVRAAAILRRERDLDAGEATAALRAFIDERFKGGRPLLWGHHLRQFLLGEMIYRRTLGLDLLVGTRHAVSPPAWAQRDVQMPAAPRGMYAAGTRVLVIGAGLAGLAAAVHAVMAGARVTVLASGIGRLILTPGWMALGLFRDHPGPRAFLDWCAANGLLFPGGDGMPPLTALGAVAGRGHVGTRHAVSLPETLIVGFAMRQPWRDFDADLCAGNLAAQGIPSRAIHIDLPGPHPGLHDGWDLSPTELAHRFDDPLFRDEAARLVKGRLRGEARVGFPAVLGLHHHAAVMREMAERIGRPVFEIPTLPPSVPGTRLFNALRRWLLAHGARLQIGPPVTQAVVEGDRVAGVAVMSAGRETVFRADTVILATGGLYGGGLLSDDRGRVWEPIFNLSVQADGDRMAWFRDDLLHPQGHPVHAFGLQVDESLRPLAADGRPAYGNLFAAGHIIGGMDTLLTDCDEGFDLASAYAAVASALSR